MKFSDVIGQQEAGQRLTMMVQEGKVPHAIMLCGPKGCGKMAVAMAFGSYLLGERDDSDPSLSAETPEQQAKRRNATAMLGGWAHPDLTFAYPVIRPAGTGSEHKMSSDDFAKEWRGMLMQSAYFDLNHWLEAMGAANQQALMGAGESNRLLKRLSLKSSQGGYKVCIIWLPERMNGECANKLLKLLEEPPSQTVFVMVCEEPEKLLETIISRTQRIDLKRIGTPHIAAALNRQRGIEPEAAQRIARLANGNWLAALDELNAGSEKRMFLDMYKMLMRLAYAKNIKDLKKWSDAVAGYGREKQKRLLQYFLRMTRENFMYNFHNPELTYMTREEEDFASKFARFINEENVIDMADMLTRAIRDLAQNANAKIVFFDIATQTIVMLMRR